MECREFDNYAEQWMEGERQPEAAAHIETCAACRGLIADLEAVRAAAAAWASEEAEPPARVWVSLHAQLEAEGLIRTEEKVSWFARLFPMPLRPALADLALLVLVAGLVTMQSEFRGTPRAMAALESELSRVEKSVVQEMKGRDPAVIASYRKNLAIVDNFIALCEKSVRENPQNDLAREYLYGAYQQKADLLGTMLERGVIGE